MCWSRLASRGPATTIPTLLRTAGSDLRAAPVHPVFLVIRRPRRRRTRAKQWASTFLECRCDCSIRHRGFAHVGCGGLEQPIHIVGCLEYLRSPHQQSEPDISGDDRYWLRTLREECAREALESLESTVPGAARRGTSGSSWPEAWGRPCCNIN